MKFIGVDHLPTSIIELGKVLLGNKMKVVFTSIVFVENDIQSAVFFRRRICSRGKVALCDFTLERWYSTV